MNTIRIENNLLVGDNTDAPGFLTDLEMLGFAKPKLGELYKTATQNAIILGAGGSARAIVYALASQGWDIYVAARRVQQAAELVESFRPLVHPAKLTALALDPAAISGSGDDISLIVNTTPLGMAPDTEGCPWPDGLDFPKSACVYDLVYNPAVTRLVCTARQAELRAETGLGMLVEQAALSFELWTGHSPDRNILFAAVQKDI